MKKIIALTAALTAALSVSAEVITFNTAKDWRKTANVKVTSDGIIEFSGGRRDLCSKTFVIDPAKKYVFSAEVRTKPGTTAGICYIGNWSIAGNKFLLPEHVLAVPKSESKLLAPAIAGTDKVVIAKPACVKNVMPRNMNIAFNAKADLSDLPNFDRIPIKKGEIQGDKLVLTLSAKLKRNYAVDTPVRFQRSHMGMYGGLSNKRPGEDWTTITWTVAGRAGMATNPFLKWWNGADKGAIRIIGNYNHQKGAILQVRNVKVTITE